MVRSTSELSSAVWWMPRALLAGRGSLMYSAASRARSASMWAISIVLLQDAQFDADVAAGGPGVGADLVGRLGELAGPLPVQAGYLDEQGDDELVGVAVGADTHLGGHGRLPRVHLGLAGDQPQRTVKAGRVPGREQLFGVGAIAAAAHLNGGREVEVEAVVR